MSENINYTYIFKPDIEANPVARRSNLLPLEKAKFAVSHTQTQVFLKCKTVT